MAAQLAASQKGLSSMSEYCDYVDPFHSYSTNKPSCVHISEKLFVYSNTVVSDICNYSQYLKYAIFADDFKIHQSIIKLEN
jgi:hypothetical protein